MPNPNKSATEIADPANAAAELATAIKNIDTAFRKMRASGLTDCALITLINDVTGGYKHGVSKENIRKVLEALPKLRQEYLTP